MTDETRSKNSSYDAVIIGSGPNGLASAITLARAGKSTLVIEAESTIGGGTRSSELTLPGFTHDICSAIHPLAVGSPFFATLPLEEHGVEWIHPPSPLAHPFDDGSAAVLERSVEETGKILGEDSHSYRKLMQPLADHWTALAEELLAPPHLFRHPVVLGKFGLNAIYSAWALARRRFAGDHARGLFAGLSAHSILPLEYFMTASFGMLLGASGHAVGWPFPRGGAQMIADAMQSILKSLGGEIETDRRVDSIEDLPPARAYLFDVTPRQFLRIAGNRLPHRYRRRLEGFRYGPGVFKIDCALSGPIPWKAEACRRAATVHLGPTLEEICASEAGVWRGEPPERPFVLVAQHTLFDTTRAPEGKHTLWAYCHVPNGSTFDMTERIEAQIERFAPGFRDLIIARSVLTPEQLERHNANYIGGDISGGANDFPQLLARPLISLNPYSTPAKGVYLCSSSTPPGAGVHGMCGYFAARKALEDVF